VRTWIYLGRRRNVVEQDVGEHGADAQASEFLVAGRLIDRVDVDADAHRLEDPQHPLGGEVVGNGDALRVCRDEGRQQQEFALADEAVDELEAARPRAGTEGAQQLRVAALEHRGARVDRLATPQLATVVPHHRRGGHGCLDAGDDPRARDLHVEQQGAAAGMRHLEHLGEGRNIGRDAAQLVEIDVAHATIDLVRAQQRAVVDAHRHGVVGRAYVDLDDMGVRQGGLDRLERVLTVDVGEPTVRDLEGHLT
jgi:hypothetical protein